MRSSRLPDATAWEITRLVVAFARLQYVDETFLAAAAASLLPKLHIAWVSTAADAAWGFAAAGYHEPQLFQGLREELSRGLSKVSSWAGPEEVATVAWAFATADAVSCEGLMREAVARAQVLGVQRFSMSQLGTFCWGLTAVKVYDRRWFGSVGEWVRGGGWVGGGGGGEGWVVVEHAAALARVLAEARHADRDAILMLAGYVQQKLMLLMVNGTSGRGKDEGDLDSSSSSSRGGGRSVAEVAVDAAWAVAWSGYGLGIQLADYAIAATAVVDGGCGTSVPSGGESGSSTTTTRTSRGGIGISTANKGSHSSSSISGSDLTPNTSSSSKHNEAAALLKGLLRLALSDPDALSPADLARLAWTAAVARGGAAVTADMAAVWAAVASWGSGAFSVPEARLLYGAKTMQQLREGGVEGFRQQLLGVLVGGGGMVGAAGGGVGVKGGGGGGVRGSRGKASGGVAGTTPAVLQRLPPKLMSAGEGEGRRG